MAATGIKHKALLPWKLTEDETFPSFTSWKNAIEYNASKEDAFRPFLDSSVSWAKKTPDATHRGFTADDAVSGFGLSAADKCTNLNRFLEWIAQYGPVYLQSTITDECMSLSQVFQVIRQYYGFDQSQCQFMSYLDIRLESGERPERLYHRLRSHITDNLLTVDSHLRHDGTYPTKPELISPTLERMVVLQWLYLLHSGLPKLVMRTFSHDLQLMTLKDIRPQISRSLDALLGELQESDSSINAAFNNRRFNNQTRPKPGQSRPFSKTSSPQWRNQPVSCSVCQNLGKPYYHKVEDCPVLSFADKRRLARAFNLSVEEMDCVEPVESMDPLGVQSNE